MASPLDKQATCPNCGSPITFRFAAAKAVVCEHCRFVVARADGNLSALGKMSDLVEIPSPLGVGVTGRWKGRGPGSQPDEPFAVEGRVQLDRADAPSAPWQETLLSFPQSDKWCWIAAAQGRWYATTEVPAPSDGVPHWRSLRPGRQFVLGQYGAYTVAEVGQRRVVSAEGAMPHVAAPGQVTRFVDLGGPDGAFATIDYGDDEKIPVALFVGGQIDPSVLVLDSGAPVDAPQAKVEALACPNCGGNLPLVTPGTTERVVCRYCGTSSDLAKGALVAMMQTPKPPVSPQIPLGAEGKLAGNDVTCIGFMGRGCSVEGDRYRWREYLLYAGTRVGYVWLMEEDGNWKYVTPIPPGSAVVSGDSVHYRGHGYSLSQSVRAEVEYVVGEFYWRVEVGETVQASDYKGPDGIVSVEEAQTEMTHSFCANISGQDLAVAFGLQNLGGGSGTDGSPADFGGSSASGGLKSVLKVLLWGTIIFIILVIWCASDCHGTGSGGGSFGGPHGPSFGGK